MTTTFGNFGQRATENSDRQDVGNQTGPLSDYPAMNCEFYREAISARIDGELDGAEADALESHLALCGHCRAWADEGVRINRAARIGLAEPVPDLTMSIMAALNAVPRPVEPTRRRTAPASRPARSPVSIARFGLVMVALAQLGIALPGLLGNDAGAPVHVAREQGSWALALAIGFAMVAWRPTRARGVLPLVGVLVGCLCATTVLDVAAGRTVAAAEAPHGLAFLGLAMILLIAYPHLGQAAGHRAGPAGRRPLSALVQPR
jgi:predicted anti-sigma-YlaC factor YlaD